MLFFIRFLLAIPSLLDNHSNHLTAVIPSEARNPSSIYGEPKFIQARTSYLHSIQPFLYCSHSMPCLRFTELRGEIKSMKNLLRFTPFAAILLLGTYGALPIGVGIRIVLLHPRES